jgi:diaminohydroxyphosphoribosylaminopyrimidine deaminase / 5-amino-6-(5-phosphoribosylamino)uracil reductase
LTDGGPTNTHVSNEDEHYMRRALELARTAPYTSPNPRVGAVVVRRGRVVGEGVHRGAGTAHAEADALEGVDARGATLYVTLEPCTHHGLRPPCVPTILESKLARVVASMQDPDRRVDGRGFEALHRGGVEIVRGVLEREARALNAPFIRRATRGLPFVTLKLALSLDGRLAAPDGSARWITGPEARRHVHRRRQEADAVLVGATTVLADDPAFMVRDVPAHRQPVRIVVDARGRVPAGAALFATPGAVVATTPGAPEEIKERWAAQGAEVWELPPAAEGVDLRALVHGSLRTWKVPDRPFPAVVTEVLCEGGGRLATSLLAGDLVDRLELHYGAVVLGAGGPAIGDVGVRGIEDATRWTCTDVLRRDDDVIVTYDKTTTG